MVNFATREFNGAIADFKAVFAGHEGLFTAGQFYVTARLQGALCEQVRTLLSQNIRFIIDRAMLKKVADPICKKLGMRNGDAINWDNWKDLNDEIINDLKMWEVNGDLASARALFPTGDPTQAEKQEVQDLFQQVWNTPEVGLPGFRYPYGPFSLREASAARSLEKKKCFDVAHKMTRKYLGKKGISKLDQRLRISIGAILGTNVESGPQVGNEDQQILKYDRNALRKTVLDIKSALNAGAIVQCGVLSGIRQDRDLFKEPEHYVLIFFHGQIDGKDAFLFWDPDAASTNIKSAIWGSGEAEKWGTGFGCLFYVSDRLSTALDDADLIAITPSGNHVSEPQRHRYQVYYVRTWPM